MTTSSTELGGTTVAAKHINQLFQRIPLIDNMSTKGKTLVSSLDNKNLYCLFSNK
jgi:hypothetical protein